MSTDTVNDTSELAVNQDYTAINRLGRQQYFACMVYDSVDSTAINRLGRQQVFACMVYDSVDSTGRTYGFTPMVNWT